MARSAFGSPGSLLRCVDMIRSSARFAIACLGPLLFCLTPTRAETGGELELFASTFRPHTNTAYVYVRNTGAQPATFRRLLIDGRAESAELYPVDPARKAHWFDCIPPTVPPRGVAQVRVNLREAPAAKGVGLSVEMDGATKPFKAVVKPAAPKAVFTDIGFNPDGSTVTLFVGGDDLKIQRVSIDGEDVTARSDLRGGETFRGTAVVSARPATPLARGSYHTYQVASADGRVATYTARTLPGRFIIGTYGNADHFAAYAENGLNHYTSFRQITPELTKKLASLNLRGGPVPFVGGIFHLKTKAWIPFDIEKSRQNIAAIKDSGAVDFYVAPDEPDGYDAAAKERGMHGRAIVAMRQLAAEVDPATPTLVQIDNSMRPHNYRIYAEAMDCSATHRYNLGQEFFTGDREATGELRASAQPNPYLWVTQFYPVREKAGERVAYNGRFPLPGEMHIQMLEALANGSKGVIHYIHSGSTGGRGGAGSDAALWASMKPMHEQLAAAGPIVARSTPTTWASASTTDARAVALLADPANVLVVITNQAAVSTKTGFGVPPLRNVDVTVALPTWAPLTEVVEIAPGGQLKPIPFKKQGDTLVVPIESLDVGTILWLRGVQAK
jgi:hypothetical protein